MESQDKSKMSLAGKRRDETPLGPKLFGIIKSSLRLNNSKAEAKSPAYTAVAHSEDFPAEAAYARTEAETKLRLVQMLL
jgi:hypothetical protein